MTIPRSKRDRAIALFEPDEDGFSDWVSVSEFVPAGLNWGNNGNIRRGVAFGLTGIKWGVERVGGPRSAVTALRMEGWNDDEEFDQIILPSVRSAFESVVNCNISMLPVPRPDREVDHRYGYKEHPDYVSLYSAENQQVKDFQLIHRVLNLQKRQMCVTCVKDGERPPHPTLGYAEGDASLAERFPCKGCFLAEPERFRGLK